MSFVFAGCTSDGDEGDKTPTGSDEISKYIIQLRSDDWDTRKDAIDALVERGSASVPLLIEEMAAESPHLRFRAALVLGLIGPDAKAGVPKLIEGLKDRNPYVRLHSARALGQIGTDPETVTPALIAALEDDDQKVRGFTVDALSMFVDTPGVSDALLNMIDEEDPDVSDILAEVIGIIGVDVVPDLLDVIDGLDTPARKTAVRTLSIILQDPGVINSVYIPFWLDDNLVRGKAGRWFPGRDSMVDGVVSTLVSIADDEDLRLEVLRALGRIAKAGPGVVPVLIEASRDEEIIIAMEGIRALSRFGAEPGVVQALITVLRSNEKLRLNVAEALALIGQDAAEALPDLIDILEEEEDGSVRKYAAQAIGEIGIYSRSAVAALIAELNKENEDARGGAAYALGQLDSGSPEVVDALLSALNHENIWVRKNACNALGMIRVDAARVVPALIESLDDEHPYVRSAATLNLGRYGDEAIQAVPKLRGMIKEEESSVVALTYALFMIGDEPEKRLDALINFLESEDQDILNRVFFYIGEIGPAAADAVPALIEGFSEWDGLNASSAAGTLAKIGPPAKKALPVLRKAADSQGISACVRAGILDSINEIDAS